MTPAPEAKELKPCLWCGKNSEIHTHLMTTEDVKDWSDCWGWKEISRLEDDIRTLRIIEQNADKEIRELKVELFTKDKQIEEWIADRDTWFERYKRLRIDSDKELQAEKEKIKRLRGILENWKSLRGKEIADENRKINWETFISFNDAFEKNEEALKETGEK